MKIQKVKKLMKLSKKFSKTIHPIIRQMIASVKIKEKNKKFNINKIKIQSAIWEDLKIITKIQSLSTTECVQSIKWVKSMK